MNSKDKSILMQKAFGTYDRNEYIRLLHKQGKNFAEIGRLPHIKLSRQAVSKIAREW